MPFLSWFDNLDKLVRGRQRWSAESEYAYYRVTPEAVREHRERQAGHARESFLTGMLGLRSMGLLDRNLLEGATVLDVGAGEGMIAEGARQAGAAEVWAADAVPKQLWAAAERFPDDAVLRFLITSADDTPFEEGAFDVVLAHLVLHHIEPLDGVAREILRVLRPGGRFVASEPTPLIGALAHERTSANEAPISPQHVVSTLERCGFERVQVRYHWHRLHTSALGPLSPGYVVTAYKPGRDETSRPHRVQLRRPVAPMTLSGMSIDSQCRFEGDAFRQQAELLALGASNR